MDYASFLEVSTWRNGVTESSGWEDVPFCNGDRSPVSHGGDGGGEVGAGKRGFTGSTMSPMKPADCGLAMERQASPTTERRKGGGVSGKKFFLGIQGGKLKGSTFSCDVKQGKIFSAERLYSSGRVLEYFFFLSSFFLNNFLFWGA